MKTCIFTLSHNEDIMLPVWLRYYDQHFDHVVVIDHATTDGAVERASEEFAFETIPLDSESLWNYPVNINHVIRIRKELLDRGFAVVAFADVDEFIVPDPDHYLDLADYIAENDYKIAWCTGYQVLQLPDEPSMRWDRALLRQRSRMAYDPLYSKPTLARVSIPLSVGAHRVEGHDPYPDPQLLMFHLRYADMGVCLERFRERYKGKAMARMMATEQPLWKRAEPIPDKYRHTF